MSSKFIVRMLFHGVTAVMYFCALVRFEYLPPMPLARPKEHYAGRFKYLTYWNLVVQFAFFCLACLIDIMDYPSVNHYKLTRFRDKLYSGIVLPYGVFVVSMFWGLYAIDRELIFPKTLDAVFPAWLNHVVHTMVLPVLLMETYMIRHRHPRRKEGLTYCALFGIMYMAWVLYLALSMDIWVYPILHILNWPQRVFFFALSIGVISFMYIIGERINRLFWGESIVFKTK